MAVAPRNLGPRPTITAVALGLTDANPTLDPFTEADVRAAARSRGIPMRDGRLEVENARDALADIYFAIAAKRGWTP